MQPSSPIKTTLTRHPGARLANISNPEFGQEVCDHMLICDYSDGSWHAPQITPFTNLSMSPTTLALHYGQTVFEGMKAFRTHDGGINIFRMDKHYDRFSKSLMRMCMPVPPKEVFFDGILQLVKLDNVWLMDEPGSTLYIRPFMYASEARFGVHVSNQYRFVIFTGPVGSYYPRPLRVKVETDFIRAAPGGTGYAKCGGNYGGAFYPGYKAKQEGYDQVIWTDGKDHKYIEESGTMNVMFVINDMLITPPLSDSILDGVTRDTLLILANDLGIKTAEATISIDELKDAFITNSLSEAFGVGTAAVIAPISLINIAGIDYPVQGFTEGVGQVNPGKLISSRLKDHLTNIRTGLAPDIHNWNLTLNA